MQRCQGSSGVGTLLYIRKAGRLGWQAGGMHTTACSLVAWQCVTLGDL